MDLRIDDNEAEVLNRVLRNWLPRLEQEAYATDSNHWGSDPMEDEAVIVSLVERLEAAAKKPMVKLTPPPPYQSFSK
jgi:hypothetical protein